MRAFLAGLFFTFYFEYGRFVELTPKILKNIFRLFCAS